MDARDRRAQHHRDREGRVAPAEAEAQLGDDARGLGDAQQFDDAQQPHDAQQLEEAQARARERERDHVERHDAHEVDREPRARVPPRDGRHDAGIQIVFSWPYFL